MRLINITHSQMYSSNERCRVIPTLKPQIKNYRIPSYRLYFASWVQKANLQWIEKSIRFEVDSSNEQCQRKCNKTLWSTFSSIKWTSKFGRDQRNGLKCGNQRCVKIWKTRIQFPSKPWCDYMNKLTYVASSKK